MDPNQRDKDSKKYLERRDLSLSNANLFISNNSNPFLISPYSPPTNIAKQSQVNNINIVISSLIGNLGAVINLSTLTLSISTIQPPPFGPQDLTIRASTLYIDTEITDITGELNVSSISTGYLFASAANFSTLTVSTFNISNENIINKSNWKTSNVIL